MASLRHRPALRRFRRASLVLLILASAALAILLLARPGAPPEGMPEEDADVAVEADRPVRGEGFEYTQTRGGRALFRLEGDFIELDREERVYLEGVALVFFRDGGEVYRLRSRRAIYEPEGHRTDLMGEVTLHGPRGLWVRGDGLRMVDKGQTLVSSDPVRLGVGEDVEGRADSLHLDLATDTVTLHGDCRVTGRGEEAAGWTLTSDELRYERPSRRVVAGGGVRLEQEGFWLESERLEGLVSEDETTFRRATASVAVRGLAAELDVERPASRAHFRGAELELDLPETLRPGGRATLSGRDTARAEVVVVGIGPSPVRLLGRRLVATRSTDERTHLEGEGSVEILERGGEGRRARGERLAAYTLVGGEPQWAHLSGGVELWEPRFTATGEEASFDWTSGHGELRGPEARIRGDQEEVRAPRIFWTEADTLLHAAGGVRARFEGEAARLEPTAGRAGEPLHVEAERGFWRLEPEGFLFEGGVRAWQGERVLVAETLLGLEAERRLTAEGGVRTLWPAGADGEPAAEPIRVWSERMEYAEARHEVLYTGGVKVRHDGQELDAAEVRVELDEASGGARRMSGEGDVVLRDLQRGTRARAQRGDYDLGTGRLVLVGEPVELIDRDGSLVRGPRLVYDTGDGRARIEGADRAEVGD